MQSSTTETTSSTSTPSSAGSDAASGASGANNFLWILPFTIACAIIYWYLTKRRDLPSEITIDKSDLPKSNAKGNSNSSSGLRDGSATIESDDVARRQPKPTAKKKTKNKKKAPAKPPAQVSANQTNSGGLSKRERKMLAARLTPSDTTISNVTKPVISPDGDASNNEITNPQPVKAIFEPIRVATPVKPELEAEEPTKVETKREPQIEVVSKPAKSGVFVPQKRELLVADRNADRWGTVESGANAFVPQQQAQSVRDSSSTIAVNTVNSVEAEQASTEQGSSRSGLKNFVSKVRAKTPAGAESN